MNPNLARFDQLMSQPKKTYVFKFISPETQKFNLSAIVAWSWKWHKAGKSWTNAMKQAWSDAKHELFTLRFKPSDNPTKGMENISRETAKYWNYGS